MARLLLLGGAAYGGGWYFSRDVQVLPPNKSNTLLQKKIQEAETKGTRYTAGQQPVIWGKPSYEDHFEIDVQLTHAPSVRQPNARDAARALFSSPAFTPELLVMRAMGYAGSSHDIVKKMQFAPEDKLGGYSVEDESTDHNELVLHSNVTPTDKRHSKLMLSIIPLGTDRIRLSMQSATLPHSQSGPASDFTQWFVPLHRFYARILLASTASRLKEMHEDAALWVQNDPKKL